MVGAFDLSTQEARAVPSEMESVLPSPSISVASNHRARSGMVSSLSAVLAGTKVLTSPHTLPPELLTLLV